jgi:hypothetical protein
MPIKRNPNVPVKQTAQNNEELRKKRDEDLIQSFYEPNRANYFSDLSTYPAAQLIIKKFFLDLNRPERGEEDFLEPEKKVAMLFGVKFRNIEFFKVLKPFEIAGQFMPGPECAKLQVPQRKVKRRSLLIVRTDDREAHQIEVQIFFKFSDPDTVSRIFRLTPAQWKACKRNLKQVGEENT